FSTRPELDHVCYLDADLLFLGSLAPLWGELADASVGIVPHRFPPRLRHLEAFGVYNVQFVYFRRDASGTACLSNWRRDCLAWCYDRIEDDRMGDQKYLDAWPNSYPGVRVVTDIGAGVALWNIEQHRLERDGD